MRALKRKWGEVGGGGGENLKFDFLAYLICAHAGEQKFKMFLNPWPLGIDLVPPPPPPLPGEGEGGNSFFRLIS